MSVLDELGTAAQCVLGARQAIARALDEWDEFDDLLAPALAPVTAALEMEQVRIGELINRQKEIER